MKQKLNNQYFILRHGQTTQQTKKKEFTYNWPDKPPVKLTRIGEKQIKTVAKKLKNNPPSSRPAGLRRARKINLIYSSDTFRTKQTAEIIAKELGLKINFDKRLRDINLGIYHGRPKKEFYQDFPVLSKRFYKRPKKGESWVDCRKRTLNFLKEIDTKHKNKKILIISHGDPLWLLEGAVKGWSNQELLQSKDSYIKVGELRKL